MFRYGGKNAPKVYAGVSPRKGAGRSRRPTPDVDPQVREKTEPVRNTPGLTHASHALLQFLVEIPVASPPKDQG